MANITTNRLNFTLMPEQVNAVKMAVNNIYGNLPILIGLTATERVNLPKINVSNKAFTEDAINAMVNNAALLPPYITVLDLQNDLTLYNQLDELKTLVQQLLEKIEDTQILAGSEAYSSGLIAYRMYGAAADAGIPGADSVYAQLKKRFVSQGTATQTTGSNTSEAESK